MLTIDQLTGQGRSVSRRGFLQVGTLAIDGLGLADILRQRALAGGNSSRPKSAIMIHLSGGPSHLDMYDMKPQAPAEYRGEFSPISTNVPGMEICELMPLQAKIADKFAIVRGAQIANLHTGNMFYSGYPGRKTREPRFPEKPAVRPSAPLPADSVPARKTFRRTSASRTVPTGNGPTTPASSMSRSALAVRAPAKRSTTWAGATTWVRYGSWIAKCC